MEEYCFLAFLWLAQFGKDHSLRDYSMAHGMGPPHESLIKKIPLQTCL